MQWTVYSGYNLFFLYFGGKNKAFVSARKDFLAVKHWKRPLGEVVKDTGFAIV